MFKTISGSVDKRISVDLVTNYNKKICLIFANGTIYSSLDRVIADSKMNSMILLNYDFHIILSSEILTSMVRNINVENYFIYLFIGSVTYYLLCLILTRILIIRQTYGWKIIPATFAGHTIILASHNNATEDSETTENA